MPEFKEQLADLIRGRSALIYLQSQEEERVQRVVREIASSNGLELLDWTCIRGLSGEGEATRDPVAAVSLLISSAKPGIYIFSDISEFLGLPELKRVLREFASGATAGTSQFIVIVDAELRLPESLRNDLNLIVVPPPDESEIEAEFMRISTDYPDSPVAEDLAGDIINALKGLTLREAGGVLHRMFSSGNCSRDELFEEIFTEKQMIIRKSGYLEFVPPRETIDGIGGLGYLKDWLKKRERIFSKEALGAGIPIPKGLLVMGVSGCGKSMAVKTISALWNVPLFRLDMNLIFSGLYGSPEATFHKALQLLESVAPVIVWIDEIENALGIEEDGITISSHIFSSFLTWMQEKPPLVFMAATANRIQALPAEILRKGRFDQIFFVDLPNESERKDIFRIYLEKHGADLAKFDLKMLSILSKNWNGAEIAQIVASARTDAFAEEREFVEGDITANINKTVPLATTMETQIKGIRSWALSRATPASEHGKIMRY